MVCDVTRLEIQRVLGIVVVTVIADLDQRTGDQWLEQHNSVLTIDRVHTHGIGGELRDHDG